MSLNITLDGEEKTVTCICSGCGNEHTSKTRDCLYFGSITHNLTKMAKEAGLYLCIWHPEDVGITKAKQLIEPLRSGLYLLKSDPQRFKQFNPSNGWGTYEDLVEMVERYVFACSVNPEALVSIHR